MELDKFTWDGGSKRRKCVVYMCLLGLWSGLGNFSGLWVLFETSCRVMGQFYEDFLWFWINVSYLLLLAFDSRESTYLLGR